MATVLIVEDQEQILTLARSFLEEQGHKTLSAATADEALAILTGSEAVDTLFVDIILNGGLDSRTKCNRAMRTGFAPLCQAF